MTANRSVLVGGLELKNPIICGSGEHLMTAAGIRAALEAGAAAVVAKSTNESAAAASQLDRTDYVRLDDRLEPINWQGPAGVDASLLGRSGLVQREPRAWLDELAALDREAARDAAYVVGNLIPADTEVLLDLAAYAQDRGLRVLEVNLGAPHGREAASGAIVLEQRADRVRELYRRVRQRYGGTLWAKLTGMSEDVAALAAAARDGGADAVAMAGRSMAMLPSLDTHRPVLGTNAAYGGRWALPITCRWLAATRAQLGPDYPLIGTNGARDGYDIARMLLAGARAVEICSVVMVDGFGAVRRCLADLDTHLERKGMAAADLVGVAADQVEAYSAQDVRPGHWKAFVPGDAVEPE